MSDERVSITIRPPTRALTRSAIRAAMAEVDADIQDRLVAFDGGAELLSWSQAHQHHGDEPYLGCVFCRDRFVRRAQLMETERMLLAVLDLAEQERGGHHVPYAEWRATIDAARALLAKRRAAR